VINPAAPAPMIPTLCWWMDSVVSTIAEMGGT
jgi:hypothetical protein